MKSNATLSMCEPVDAEYQCAGQPKLDMSNAVFACALVATPNAPAVLLSKCQPGANPYVSVTHRASLIKDSDRCAVETAMLLSCSRGGTVVSKCKGANSRTDCNAILPLVCTSSALSRFGQSASHLGKVVGSVLGCLGVHSTTLALLAVGLSLATLF